LKELDKIKSKASVSRLVNDSSDCLIKTQDFANNICSKKSDACPAINYNDD